MAEPGSAAELATPASPTATGERVTSVQLHAWLEAGEPVLVLDVRGREQWTAELERIPGATWMPIEELPRRASDLPARRLVVYCSSPGEARSARTARWLEDHGHRDVFVLGGGLAAWRSAGLPVETMRLDLAAEAEAAEQAPGLPTLLEQYRRAGRLPTRVRLATLFVDIVGSMRLLAHHPPEQVLAFVQRFMALVTEIALAYCGDVKDFEGDGALLYFDSTTEAASAALAIRDALAGGRECADAACPVSARLSLTVGDVVLGEIGAAGRRAVALVGPSVGIGARLLKQIEPGGIIASGEVVEELRQSAPDLAARCRLLHAALAIPGADGVRVAAYTID